MTTMLMRLSGVYDQYAPTVVTYSATVAWRTFWLQRSMHLVGQSAVCVCLFCGCIQLVMMMIS